MPCCVSIPPTPKGTAFPAKVVTGSTATDNVRLIAQGARKGRTDPPLFTGAHEHDWWGRGRPRLRSAYRWLHWAPETPRPDGSPFEFSTCRAGECVLDAARSAPVGHRQARPMRDRRPHHARGASVRLTHGTYESAQYIAQWRYSAGGAVEIDAQAAQQFNRRELAEVGDDVHPYNIRRSRTALQAATIPAPGPSFVAHTSTSSPP